jgi:hypothetical protein
MNKVIVITSNSIYSDLLYIKDNIIICNDNNFSQLINEILDNYDYYYYKIFSKFDYEEYILYIKKNLDIILS